MGKLHYFLGISVEFFSDGLFPSQAKYAHDLLDRAQMQGYKPVSTHMVTKLRATARSNNPFLDLLFYISVEVLLAVFNTSLLLILTFHLVLTMFANLCTNP